MKKSIIIAGLGGQGVITAARILAEAAMRDGHNVISSKTIGMGQRSGSVVSTVRIGEVYSPTIASGTADVLIALDSTEGQRHMAKMKPDAYILYPHEEALGTRTLNIFMLGALIASGTIPVAKATVRAVISERIKPEFVELNLKAFEMGKRA